MSKLISSVAIEVDSLTLSSMKLTAATHPHLNYWFPPSLFLSQLSISISLSALASSKVLAELCRLLLRNGEDALGQRRLLAAVGGTANAQLADPPHSRASWQPLGLTSIPQSRPTAAVGLESLPFSLCSAPTPLPHPLETGTSLEESSVAEWIHMAWQDSRQFQRKCLENGSSMVAVWREREGRGEVPAGGGLLLPHSRLVTGCWYGDSCMPSNSYHEKLNALAWLLRDHGQGQAWSCFFSERFTVFSVTRTSLRHLIAQIFHRSKDF